MRLLNKLFKKAKSENLSQHAGHSCHLSDKVLSNKRLLLNVSGGRGAGAYEPPKQN